MNKAKSRNFGVQSVKFEVLNSKNEVLSLIFEVANVKNEVRNPKFDV